MMISFSARTICVIQAVETRNFTGTQLIDRNDELCILWEKANIQVGSSGGLGSGDLHEEVGGFRAAEMIQLSIFSNGWVETTN